MEIKKILREYDIKVKGKRDQYFLIHDDVAVRMVEYANVREEDVVVEIGAGVGNITVKLEKKAKKVYAIEKDRELCKILRERCGNSKSEVEVIQGDVMKIDLPECDKIIANIPFSLSSPLTYKMLLDPKLAVAAVLLYQKEFALKMTAIPNTKLYRRLSVISQVLADVEIIEIVPRTAFYPPSVESAVVRWVKKKMVEAEEEKNRLFFHLVNTAFTHRRKKMKNIIKAFAGDVNAGAGAGQSADVTQWLEKRPAELSPDEYTKLAKNIISYH